MSQVIDVRNEYRMAEFKDILAPQKARGLSERAFYFEHGISQHTYCYRLRKLRQQMKGGLLWHKNRIMLPKCNNFAKNAIRPFTVAEKIGSLATR